MWGARVFELCLESEATARLPPTTCCVCRYRMNKPPPPGVAMTARLARLAAGLQYFHMTDVGAAVPASAATPTAMQ
jgi:hypothetical protein